LSTFSTQGEVGVARVPLMLPPPARTQPDTVPKPGMKTAYLLQTPKLACA
jgi:hypothetical protein